MNIVVAKKDIESALKVVSPTIAGSGPDLNSHFTFVRKEKTVEI